MDATKNYEPHEAVVCGMSEAGYDNRVPLPGGDEVYRSHCPRRGTFTLLMYFATFKRSAYASLKTAIVRPQRLGDRLIRASSPTENEFEKSRSKDVRPDRSLGVLRLNSFGI